MPSQRHTFNIFVALSFVLCFFARTLKEKICRSRLYQSQTVSWNLHVKTPIRSVWRPWYLQMATKGQPCEPAETRVKQAREWHGRWLAGTAAGRVFTDIGFWQFLLSIPGHYIHTMSVKDLDGLRDLLLKVWVRKIPDLLCKTGETALLRLLQERANFNRSSSNAKQFACDQFNKAYDKVISIYLIVLKRVFLLS